MEVVIFWAIFGGVVGYAASQSRGFSTGTGVLVGMLLGIFSLLMFLAKGDQKKCPACAEMVKPDATICKHCRTDLHAPATHSPNAVGSGSPEHQAMVYSASPKKSPPWTAIACVAILAFSLFAYLSTPPAPQQVAQSRITLSNYMRIQEAMTLNDVESILGSAGVEQSRSEMGGFTTVMYAWQGPGAGNMNAMFQNGKLVTKAQFGLE